MKFAEFKLHLGKDLKALRELFEIVDYYHRGAVLPGDAAVTALNLFEKDTRDLEYDSWLSDLRLRVRRIAQNTGGRQPYVLPETYVDEDGNLNSRLDRVPSSIPTPEEIYFKKEVANRIDLVIDGGMLDILREHVADFRAIKRLEILSPQTGHEKKWLAQCIGLVNPLFLVNPFRQRFHRWNEKFKEIWLRRWP